ncbi:MAG: C10 family peptidase [Bacteroidetes bacterium]|nr:C10 family peptidase [Bacteroidota bacterium]
MRKLSTLLLSLLVSCVVFGTSVTKDRARQAADNYFQHFSGMSNLKIMDSFSHDYNGITTYYVFNYDAGGFVVISADDAITPVLAESNTGYFNMNIDIPAVKYWFDNYDKDIAHIIAAKYDNNKTLAEWNQLIQNDFPHSPNDVTPLLTTTWDQGCYYNAQCPAATAPMTCNHVYTGCVATTMSQIEKFWAFPAQGYLSHTYTDPTYGQQTANFGATTYNWAGMPNNVSGANANVATIMYHNGVAVNMTYGVNGSGAFSEDVPAALVTYYNYDPATISMKDITNYSTTGWSNLLKAELDLHRPIYYSGDDGTTGHAWVCDGYRSSDNKFHMNWGWSGSYNAYYAIGSLNAGGYTPNQNNKAIIGIKPGNPDLVVRFTNVLNNQQIGFGGTFDINASVLTGTATSVSILIDGSQVYTSPNGTISYPWATGQSTEGDHVLKVLAINATDTAYQEVTVALSQWIPQASAFTTASRGINCIHAVDSLVCWASAYDGSGGAATINEFTKTTNGGETWTAGQIIGGTTYGIGNICGLSGTVAYVDVYNGVGNQDNTCGVYKTSNGGTTWTHLVGALQGSTSFADNVWFWNENEGMCHGDVKDNYFEIYTTSNGGTTWTRVPKANIGGGANPTSGEGGWTSVIQAVGDSTIMFGSNKAKLYISFDRGHNWVIKPTGITPITDGINKIAFKDKLNGLVAQTNTTVVLRETHDGGSTWTTITPTGSFFTNDITFVEGTDNTFVCTGADVTNALNGAAYSFDGGHSWALFNGTDLQQYLAVDFVNSHCGWAGGFNVGVAEGGMFKYVGVLEPSSTLATVSGLNAQVTDNSVHLSWLAPGKVLAGYNIYRNDTLLNSSPIPVTFYHDAPVANGKQTYCVTAVYDNGESTAVCVDAWITVGIPNSDPAAFNVYPNPATEVINLITPTPFQQVRILTMQGQEVYNYNTPGNNLRILTEGIKPGMYLMQITSEDKLITKKISIR